MTTAIIITICLLLIFAYVFEISSSKTKIPSVILLLVVGWLVRQLTDYFALWVPDLTEVLPILGTVGLVLIVLEGSLELEMNKSKLPFIGKTAIISLVPMLLFCVGLAFGFHYFGGVSLKVGLANAIPFAIISSAIAIPSVQNLSKTDKEFITYESSLSDIFGVILFNFITLNDHIGTQSIGHFFLELLVMLVVTLISTIALVYLLGKIKHHVKFIPIILMIVLIYSVSKVFHLPALIFILLFGLFLHNLDEFKNLKLIERLQPELLNKEIHKFKELTTEMAFLVRALFFILFGYLINTSELLNSETIIWALAICVGIFIIRFIFLKSFKINTKPLLYIAPRGLITILLFFSIPTNQIISLANKSLIIQVIVLTAIIMMFGLLSADKKPKMEQV